MDQRIADALAKKREEIGDDPERLAKFEALAKQLRAKLYDQEDSTEEFRGLAAIPAEAMTLGILGDEARAAGRAAVAKAADFIGGTDYAGTFKEEYELALEDERRVEAETYRDYPIASYGTQIAFGLVPAARIAKTAGVGASAAQGAMRQGVGAALEGGVYGFTEGEDGVVERLENAGKVAAISGALGGAGGALAGRFSDTNPKVLAKKAARQKAQEEAIQKAESAVTPEDFANSVNRRMTERAENLYRETGETLQGPKYMDALKETAKEMGVPVAKVRNIEGLKFFEQREFIEKLDDYVPAALSRAKINAAKSIWRNNITPIVKKAETVVGKSFAGRMQRYATRMAQTGDEITTFFKDKDIQSFGALMEGPDSSEFRANLLNMSNLDLDMAQRAQYYKKMVDTLRERKQDAALRGFNKLRARLYQEQSRQSKTVNSFIEPDQFYWPAQFKNETLALRGRDNTSRAKQTNMMNQKRGVVNNEQAMMFENPVVHADNWIRASSGLSEMFDTFKLRNAKATSDIAKKARQGKMPTEKQVSRAAERARQQVAGGEWAFKELGKRLKAEGAEKGTRDHAISLMRALAVDGSRGPNQIISNFRKAAYMGTIGNPYSAVLNLGDVFNSAVNFGVRNTARGLYDTLKQRGLRINADDVGLMHQTTGEFLRDGVTNAQRRFDAWSDATFRISQFRRFDRLGKDAAMTSAIRQNQKRALNAKDFAERWDGIFDKYEQAQLRKAILSNEKTQLVKEMAAAELSKMQPTDMASLPQWFLENPNGRVLYMLRTFGLKQIQQMDDLIVQQWKKGNKKQAMKNMLAFTMITGGGNAVLQEARQTLKGDTPNFSLDVSDKGLGYRFVDHMLGAGSANMVSLYGLDMSRKQGNAGPLVQGAMPPFAMALAPIIDVMQIADSEDIDVGAALHESEVLGWAPFGRLIQDWFDDKE
jgi:hypothetical protein